MLLSQEARDSLVAVGQKHASGDKAPFPEMEGTLQLHGNCGTLPLDPWVLRGLRAGLTEKFGADRLPAEALIFTPDELAEIRAAGQDGPFNEARGEKVAYYLGALSELELPHMKVAFVRIHCPVLAMLRQSVGLSPQPSTGEFSCPIAVVT